MIGVEPLVKIQFLDGQGLSKTQIARRLGVDRKTVRKCLVPGSVGGSGRSSHWRLGQPLPEVGIMVSDPRMPGQVLLMLSAHPYHWHVRAAAL